jgi:hypothetical protein
MRMVKCTGEMVFRTFKGIQNFCILWLNKESLSKLIGVNSVSTVDKIVSTPVEGRRSLQCTMYRPRSLVKISALIIFCSRRPTGLCEVSSEYFLTYAYSGEYGSGLGKKYQNIRVSAVKTVVSLVHVVIRDHKGPRRLLIFCCCV